MRVDYHLGLTDVEVPRFSVEAIEGISKLFTLATLVMNVLETKSQVELVFHGQNPGDPGRKIEVFKQIASCSAFSPQFVYTLGQGGSVPGASNYFQWITVGVP